MDDNNEHTMASCIRGYHVYNDIWSPYIIETLKYLSKTAIKHKEQIRCECFQSKNSCWSFTKKTIENVFIVSSSRWRDFMRGNWIKKTLNRLSSRRSRDPLFVSHQREEERFIKIENLDSSSSLTVSH